MPWIRCHCSECGTPMDADRRALCRHNANYCSGACRQAAYRRRLRDAHDESVRYPPARCKRCGRRLHNVKSVLNGIGPICACKARIDPSRIKGMTRTVC